MLLWNTVAEETKMSCLQGIETLIPVADKAGKEGKLVVSCCAMA